MSSEHGVELCACKIISVSMERRELHVCRREENGVGMVRTAL